MDPAKSYIASRNDSRIRHTHPSCASINRARCAEIVADRGGVTPFNLLPIHGITPRESESHGAATPIELASWWVRYITPPGGIVLDPFMGCGTTGAACMWDGFRFIGIEQMAEYVDVARARIARAYEESALIWEQQREATSNG